MRPKVSMPGSPWSLKADPSCDLVLQTPWTPSSCLGGLFTMPTASGPDGSVLVVLVVTLLPRCCRPSQGHGGGGTAGPVEGQEQFGSC